MMLEFIMIIPLFFIVMSGINLYLNQEIKSMTDNSAHDALLITDAHFDDEERMQLQWNGAHVKTAAYNREILKHSFNASQYFNKSVDLNHGVFQDKKNVTQTSQNTCAKIPRYKLNFSQFGQFKFESCADGSGFEATNFSYQNMFENFKPNTTAHQGRSLYYPSEEFLWNQRNAWPAIAVKEFEVTGKGQTFTAQYASFHMPSNSTQFNRSCLMNAGRVNAGHTNVGRVNFENSIIQNTPIQSCTIPSLKGKWERAAYDGANTQIFECFAEMSAQCLKAVAPPVVAACVATGTATIKLAIVSGNRASVCPILNTITAVLYEEVILTSQALSVNTSAQESTARNFFILK